MSDFVHLHCHSDFSLYDGFQTVPGMVARAKELGFPGIALTDHGKIGGFVKLSKACKPAKKYKEGQEHLAREIKPMFGCETYLVDDLENKKGKRYHCTVLAKNNKGLENLYKIVTISAENTYRNFPRMDWKILSEHGEGLILGSGCVQSKFSQHIVNGEIEEAENLAKRYKDVWGDDYYIEVMWTGYEPQRQVLTEGIRIAKKLDIKVITTNDVHYSLKEDGSSQRVKIAISRNGPLAPDEYRDHQMYMKTWDEMIASLGEARKPYMENTMEVFHKCDADIVLGQAKLPVFDIPKDNEEYNVYRKRQHPNTPDFESYLSYLSEKGLKNRGLWDRSGYRDRLYKELETIKFTGFDTYFLIVEDYCRYAREKGIRIGAGRGSGAGSLVLYCLGVTNVDPIKYELTMDRFLFCEADYRARLSDFFEDISPGLSNDIEDNVKLLSEEKNVEGFEDFCG